MKFNLEYLFKNTTISGNTRNNLVESILFSTSSPIGGIGKVWVNFHLGSYNYLPHYDSIIRKWVLRNYIFLLELIIHGYPFWGTR